MNIDPGCTVLLYQPSNGPYSGSLPIYLAWEWQKLKRLTMFTSLLSPFPGTSQYLTTRNSETSGGLGRGSNSRSTSTLTSTGPTRIPLEIRNFVVENLFITSWQTVCRIKYCPANKNGRKAPKDWIRYKIARQFFTTYLWKNFLFVLLLLFYQCRDSNLQPSNWRSYALPAKSFV